MEEVLFKIGFKKEEVEELLIQLSNLSEHVFIMKIQLFNKYKCHNDFIKEIIIKRKDILYLDIDRLEYIFDAIIANNDIIEETLLEIV